RSTTFEARGLGYLVRVAATGAELILDNPRSSSLARRRASELSGRASLARGLTNAVANTSTLHLELLRANPQAAATALDRLLGIANYLIGNDPKKWRTNIATCAKVRFSEVYPGVDWVFYGNQRQLEYDFVVAPGADPTAIELRFSGADTLA